MSTFFKLCIFYCMGLLIFSLLFGLVAATGAFDLSSQPGVQISNTQESLGELSTLSTPSMGFLFGLVAFGSSAGVFLGWVTKSIVPVGISIFGSVFWASFINTHSILSTGGFIPGELLIILTVCTVLIFIAAVIGMLTGSG